MSFILNVNKLNEVRINLTLSSDCYYCLESDVYSFDFLKNGQLYIGTLINRIIVNYINYIYKKNNKPTISTIEVALTFSIELNVEPIIHSIKFLKLFIESINTYEKNN